MPNNSSLRALLAQRKPILADGAMGTMLYACGHGFDTCFDALNLQAPSLVAHIHRQYVQAGADLVETNTFGANAYKLAAHGLDHQVREINAAGVGLARAEAEASGRPVLVAGSVGPLGVRLAPYGRVRPEQAFKAFREQVATLVEAGVDLLAIETQVDLEEVRQALLAVRSIRPVPVLVSMSFTRDDRTLLGDDPQIVARALMELGADAIGANCSGGPSQLLRLISAMRQAAPEALLSVMPNAGWPERVGGRILYPATPDYFADFARAFRGAGASIIGGCCGTSPAHITAMCRALDEKAPAERQRLFPAAAEPQPERLPGVEGPTQLARRLAEGRFVIAVEMDPPRGFATQRLIAAARLLGEAGADVINVADSPMARMRMSPWAVCHLIQREVGLESVLHFPTRGRSLLRVQGDLLAAHALGTRNLLIVMGDPTAVGDYPEALDDYDLVPTGLIELVKRKFNAGMDHAGGRIGAPTSFFVGCALNLCPPDLEREVTLLHKKIAAGADFALTQPVYDLQQAMRFLEAYRARFGPPGIPILAGILPLSNERHALFLHHEVPGVRIPADVLRRMASAGENSGEEGARIAIDLAHALAGEMQGIYLMPAFGRFDLAAQIIDSIRAWPGAKQ